MKRLLFAFLVPLLTALGELTVTPAATFNGAAPGPIGSTTPSSGAFTTLSATSAATFTGTTAMAFPYGTFTDASNYRRPLFSQSSGGALLISSSGLGTGVTGNTLSLATDGTTRWTVNSSGHLLAGSDNTFDFGASNATRPRNAFFGTSILIGTTVADSGAIRLANSGQIFARNASNSGNIEVALPFSDNVLYMGSGSSGVVTRTSSGVITLSPANVASGQFDSSATAGQTRFLLYDVDNATLERVTVGIADSGGAGFKVLRIPN